MFYAYSASSVLKKKFHLRIHRRSIIMIEIDDRNVVSARIEERFDMEKMMLLTSHNFTRKMFQNTTKEYQKQWSHTSNNGAYCIMPQRGNIEPEKTCPSKTNNSSV